MYTYTRCILLHVYYTYLIIRTYNTYFFILPLQSDETAIFFFFTHVYIKKTTYLRAQVYGGHNNQIEKKNDLNNLDGMAHNNQERLKSSHKHNE